MTCGKPSTTEKCTDSCGAKATAAKSCKTDMGTKSSATPAGNSHKDAAKASASNNNGKAK